MKKSKQALSVILALIMLLALAAPAFAADPTARTISIYKNEGDKVTMTKGTAKQFAAKTGTKLFDGYTVATGAASFSTLQLDTDSLAKLNENSEIGVNKLSGNKLSLNLRSGAMSLNAAKQKDGAVLEIRAGNSALAIRGTILVAEYIENDKLQDVGSNLGAYEFVYVVTLLEGECEIDGKLLKAGQTMYVYDRIIDRIHEIREITIDGNLSKFTLQTIWEYREKLIEAGIFTEEQINLIPDLLEKKEKATVPADIVIENDQIYYDQTPGGGGGGGGGGSSAVTGAAALYYGGSPTATTYPDLYDAYLAAQAGGAAGAGSTITVTGNATITTGQTVTVGGVSNLDSITVSAGATLTITGTGNLDVLAGGVVNNYGTINNRSNTITIDQGTLTNYSGGILNNDALPPGWIVITGSGTSALFNQGTFNNAGSLVNNGGGYFSNETGATFTNSGIFNNDAIANNTGITNNSGTITNTGSINNQSTGTLNNQAGGVVDNQNPGSFSNSATLTNDGSFKVGAAASFDNTGGAISGSGSMVLEPGSSLNGLDYTYGDGHDTGGDETVHYVWNPHAVVGYADNNIVQSLGAFTPATFSRTTSDLVTTYHWGIQDALKNAGAGDIINTVHVDLPNPYGEEYEAYKAYDYDYQVAAGLDLSGATPPPSSIVIPAGVVLNIIDSPFAVYGDSISLPEGLSITFTNKGEINVDTRYSGFFLDSVTFINDVNGIISIGDTYFLNHNDNDNTNNGRILIGADATVDFEHDIKGGAGATIEIESGFGSDPLNVSTWRNPTVYKFYNSSHVEILPFGNESSLAGHIFDWNENADDLGNPGWLAR